MASVIGAGFKTLDGPIQVRYPAGSEERAGEVQRFFADAIPFFQAKLAAPLIFTVALLGPKEWLAINPPGTTYAQMLPGAVDGTPPLIFLPAIRGHALDPIPTPPGAPDGNRVSMAVAFHELGHIVVRRMGLPQEEGSGWLGEFFAGYVAYVYMLEKRPDDAQFLDDVTAGGASRIQPCPCLPLDKMATGVGVENYMWFQLSLSERVREVARLKGWAFLEEARTLRAKTDAELLAQLEVLAPGFIAWAARNPGFVPAK